MPLLKDHTITDELGNGKYGLPLHRNTMIESGIPEFTF